MRRKCIEYSMKYQMSRRVSSMFGAIKAEKCCCFVLFLLQQKQPVPAIIQRFIRRLFPCIRYEKRIYWNTYQAAICRRKKRKMIMLQWRDTFEICEQQQRYTNFYSSKNLRKKKTYVFHFILSCDVPQYLLL